MTDVLGEIVGRFVTASGDFGRHLRSVEAGQWESPTPCSEWNVRQLVNHMARGNLNYVGLLAGATSADFLRMRDLDALGDQPVAAYALSVRECAEAFGQPGALERIVDYPSCRMSARQALAVRTTDATIHTWDLARALNADDRLDADLVAWIDDNIDTIYAGLAETPVAATTTHRFFAAPAGELDADASRQDRLLHRMGRNPF